MDLIFRNPIIQGILIVLIAAFIIYIIKLLRKSGYQIFSYFRRRRRIELGLEKYRRTLEEETLKISHPWMKEDQTLSDILVPVNFELHGVKEKEELEVYIKRLFKEVSTPRLLILGKPGSGKTIAMRVIAKLIWTIDENIEIVPILLNFSDLKGVNTHEKMEQKVVEKLRYYQFEKGKKGDKSAENFVDANLNTGKLLLLIDGYDELEKSERITTSKFLNTFLGTFKRIPAVITSRKAVYESESVFDELNLHKIEMASFTPFAILKFLSQWKFEDNKSSHELFDMINGKAHLSELASNPLMLTIITFLYSLPKYTLPDNRVQFYEQCTRALLEEWDRSQKRDRANKFESHQKIAVLNRIAFEHFSKSQEADEMIQQNSIHEFTREEMKRSSLKIEEYPKMRDEIVLNSGLLQKIPPENYRFPHRTFMEFFTANYIVTQKDYNELLHLYKQDPVKWKEILLLYIPFSV